MVERLATACRLPAAPMIEGRVGAVQMKVATRAHGQHWIGHEKLSKNVACVTAAVTFEAIVATAAFRAAR